MEGDQCGKWQTPQKAVILPQRIQASIASIQTR